ncbi:MAG: ABC transporter permease [Bacteroidetes bacterium]|nr:MAG: ABC transporter permease [Bacteroidota bacterium]
MNFEYFFASRITFKTDRKASTLVVWLSITSIALAVATMEIALSFVQGFETEIQRKVIGFSAHIQIGNYLREFDTEVQPLPKNDSSINRIRNIPNVSTISPFVHHWSVIKSPGGWEGVLMKGVDESYDWRFFATVLKEGQIPDYSHTDSSKAGQILISRKQARRLNLAVGDKARLLFLPQPIRRRPVEVAGIYETGMEEFDNSLIICDMRMLQDIWKWNENQVSGFEVNLKDITRSYDLALQPTFPFIGIDTLDPLIDANRLVRENTPFYFGTVPITDLFSEIFAWLRLQHQNVWVILVLMMIVAIINMTSVVLILIIERIRTVGILKSMGLPAFRVRRLFVWYAFFLILIGVILGNILGISLLAIQDTWGVLRVNQEDYFIERVPVAWVWNRFLWVNVGVIAVCTLFMFIPTIVINRISPLKAIRFE